MFCFKIFLVWAPIPKRGRFGANFSLSGTYWGHPCSERGRLGAHCALRGAYFALRGADWGHTVLAWDEIHSRPICIT